MEKITPLPKNWIQQATSKVLGAKETFICNTRIDEHFPVPILGNPQEITENSICMCAVCIKKRNPSVFIGRPHPTEKYTTKELEEFDLVGIYTEKTIIEDEDEDEEISIENDSDSAENSIDAEGDEESSSS